jgi:hypothetical protein
MLLNRATLPEDGKLRTGYFYIPRISQSNGAQHLPVLMSRFVAQYRASFDDEIHIPKRLELSEFGDLADHLRILVLGASRETWTFQGFAPFSAARIGMDLTGAKVNDRRFAPYNRQLDEKIARLLRENAPFYVGTYMDESEAKASRTACSYRRVMSAGLSRIVSCCRCRARSQEKCGRDFFATRVRRTA